MKKKQIVCLSTSPWYPIPTRKQQVMSRLHDAEVLYFDPPITWIAPLKDHSAKEKLWAHKKPGQHVRDGITVYTLPPVWPFFNKFRWINRHNQKKTARYVRKIMEKHGFEKPLLWTYSPVSADAVDLIPHSALVYDCVDLHSAYGGLMNPALVDEMERDLAGKADQVFATAEGLSDRLRKVNDSVQFIPNGANFELFERASHPCPCPEDLKAIPKPILGFVGALQPCIEYSWLEAAARAKPEWSFVLIGGEKPGADLGGLRTLPNVHFLGLRPHEELPDYIAQFDVCLNLFARTKLSKDVSPLKFYEYLATGKPVVSTPQPAQILQFDPIIHIARTREDFLAACGKAIGDTAPERTEARLEAGRCSSWDARVAEMEEILRGKDLL